jgi:putative endonuclease
VPIVSIRQPNGRPTPGASPARAASPAHSASHAPGASRRSSRHPEHTDARRAVGRLGEDLAAEHLTRLGFTMLARNVRTRFGEIDLIVFDGRVLAFVEVKTRRAGFGGQEIRPEQEPLPWLRPRQRARLRRLARAWLGDERHARPRARTIRFDAVGVIVDEHGRLLRLDHVEAAW